MAFDLGGGGGTAFPFENIGDSVTGRITAIEEQQQTDMQTGQPAVWENGQPKMMVRVELDTALRDPENPVDDGARAVYLRGSKKAESKSSLAAVLQAARTRTGGSAIDLGGTLTLTYVGDGVPRQRGYNAPKQYEAVYEAPKVDLSGGATQQPVPPPVAQAPQPAAPAAPAAPTPEQIAAYQAWQAAQGNQQPA